MLWCLVAYGYESRPDSRVANRRDGKKQGG